jgi:hypothetical protein
LLRGMCIGFASALGLGVGLAEVRRGRIVSTERAIIMIIAGRSRGGWTRSEGGM